MQIKELIDIATKELKDISRRPKLEAEILLAHAMQCERIDLHRRYFDEVESDDFLRMLSLRKNHIPIEYITEEVSFYSETFIIRPGVLIPRPETELLIDHAAKIIEEQAISHVVEIGTGSGIVAVMLAKHFPHLNLQAVDINPKAIALARENAERFGVSKQITFIESSLLDSVQEPIDMVISNPPYIANHYPLDATVCHEPDNALFGGESGDEIIRMIIDATMEKKISWLAIEMGYDQKATLSRYMDEKGVFQYSFYEDLAGLDRGFTAHLSYLN